MIKSAEIRFASIKLRKKEFINSRTGNISQRDNTKKATDNKTLTSTII